MSIKWKFIFICDKKETNFNKKRLLWASINLYAMQNNIVSLLRDICPTFFLNKPL